MDWDWKRAENPERYNRVYATPDEEFDACAAALRVSAADSVLDLGCGDGGFLAAARRAGASAVGVDVSAEQLALARARLGEDAKARLVNSPFLDFDPGALTFTRGFSRKALHHLSDEEKPAFFARAARWFAPGALFLLEDGVFDFERRDLDANWDALMADCAAYYGAGWAQKRDDVVYCFRKEFPAGVKAWTAALAAGGFKVIARERRSSFYGSLLAEKA